MAEKNGQEQTEKPTSKRRNDARKEGNILQSKDIITIVMLFGIFWMVRMMLPFIYRTVRQYMMWIFDGIGGDVEVFFSTQLVTVSLWSLAKCAMPLLLTSMALGILATGIQTKFNCAFSLLKPKFSKLNPLKGIKQMFSLKKVVELIKNLLKSSLLMALLYSLLKGDILPVSRMIDMNPLPAGAYMLEMSFSLVIKVCAAFTVVAFFDYLYQRWEHENSLKMTKQEVKEEFKQMEGNPEIKGRIRKLQRQMAFSRMMQKVPQADVIVRNPTHYAVAIRYNPEKDTAPMVLAKGQDELALRIIRVGEEHGVFITENRPLARALYESCQLDREIPAEFYGAVAEILVYIYKASHREDMFR